MLDRFAFELEGISSAEREIVEMVIGDTCSIVAPDETPPAAFSEFID